MASMAGGSMSRYPWPSSRLGKDEMRRLYEVSQETGKPITVLVREAVIKILGVEEAEKPDL